MEALKNHEDALAMFGSYANAIVTHGNIPAACGSLGADVYSSGLVPPEFDRVANEVLQDLAKLQFVCQHYGQRISGDDGAALVDVGRLLRYSALEIGIQLAHLIFRLAAVLHFGMNDETCNPQRENRQQFTKHQHGACFTRTSG